METLFVLARLVPPLAAVMLDPPLLVPVPMTPRITSPLLQDIGPIDGAALLPVDVVAVPTLSTPVYENAVAECAVVALNENVNDFAEPEPEAAKRYNAVIPKVLTLL